MSMTKTRGRVWREALYDELTKIDKADRAVRRWPMRFDTPMPVLILCARCKGCDHRIALDGFKDLRRHAIDTLKFRCTRCGSKDVTRIVPGSMDEAKRFLAGDEILDFAK
jgi:DNA-directed RNA polymerase subunit RPC12/RpoP